jgi:hypothetical protein
VGFFAALFFVLGLRYSRRRNNRPAIDRRPSMHETPDEFLAGRPYEATNTTHSSTAMGKAYSIVTTAVSTSSGSVSGHLNEKRLSHPAFDQHDAEALSALPQMNDDDQPTYVGIPAHLSGEKRWSGRGIMK